MINVRILSILNHSRPKTKLILSMIGLLISLFIISSVCQLFLDINYLLKANNSKNEFEYIQISKEIGIATSLGLKSGSFSTTEIQAIKSKKFICDVGPLNSNDFRVYGRFAGNSFDMFLTSVKNSFIDTDLSEFVWKKNDDFVPLIISNQFLTLMNHAVLPSQGQRPIPKIVLKQAIVNLDLTKGSKLLKTKAKVIGFSDRISSVLVPESFLNFANKELSGKINSKVSMLILKVIDSGSKPLFNFLAQNNYEVSGEMSLINSAKSILGIVIFVLLIFGGVLLLLSISLNLSQLKMIVIENKSRIQMLVLLGYSPKSIVNSILKSGLLVLSIILVFVLFFLWLTFTNSHSIIEDYKLGYPKLEIVTFVIPFVLIGVLVFLMSRSIKRQIN